MRSIGLGLLTLICALGIGGCILPPIPIWSPATSTTPEVVDPFEQNRRLGRGINLGNALEGPSEGAWGVTIAEWFFPTIAEAGFNSVRIPIRWNAEAESPYTIDPRFFERVDQVIGQAQEEGLTVVINVHHYDELANDPAGHRERFVALWSQIADHYKNYPANLLFEPLNEPHARLDASVWNEILGETITAIRSTNPTRTLIVGPANWYSINALSSLALPADDEHLIVTVHFYEPFQFTHQGAEWVSNSVPWLGTTWDGEFYQTQAVDWNLERAARWGADHNRPIYLGEFGAYSKADMASRVRWTDYVARRAESLDISWAYWEFGAGFGVYDLAARRWRTDLLHALIPPQESEATSQ